MTSFPRTTSCRLGRPVSSVPRSDAIDGVGKLVRTVPACRSSGVDIRKDLTAAETRAAEAAVADILALDEAENDPDFSRGLGL
jgi:hypothetical protein